jgi:hypothetical protein
MVDHLSNQFIHRIDQQFSFRIDETPFVGISIDASPAVLQVRNEFEGISERFLSIPVNINAFPVLKTNRPAFDKSRSIIILWRYDKVAMNVDEPERPVESRGTQSFGKIVGIPEHGLNHDLTIGIYESNLAIDPNSKSILIFRVMDLPG